LAHFAIFRKSRVKNCDLLQKYRPITHYLFTICRTFAEKICMETDKREEQIDNEVVDAQAAQTQQTPPADTAADDDLTAEIDEPSEATPHVENLFEAITNLFPDFDLTKENLNGWVVEALRQYQAADSRIDEVLQTNPEFAEILKRVYEGEDAISAMASVVTPEEYADMVENGGAKAKEARDGRVKHLKEIREWEKTRTDNMGVSEETVRQYQSETGKSDDEMMRILKTMDEINSALNDGKITKRELALIDKLLGADANAQTAAEAAATAARNQKIDAQKAVDFKPGGDGLPSIASAGGQTDKQDPLANSLFGGERKSVWG
jgi:hypothetical protein